MPENSKTEEFLKKLAPCIDRGELEKCVEEATRVAGEMGIVAEKLLDLSSEEEMDNRFTYVLALAAVQGLKGEDKADAYVDAALASSELGLKQKEEEHYKKALEFDLKNPEAHYNYAILLEELGRKNEAEEHYKKALELDPKDPDVHDNYGIFLAKQSRKIEAEEYFRKAIELDPEDARTHSNYANFLIQNGRFSKAEKEVRTALYFEPNYPYALGTLGYILADEGSFEEAIKEYQKALKNSALMKPEATSAIHNKLGWIYAQLKQYKKAKEEFKKAVAFDFLNVKAIRNLRKLGKVEAEIENCKFKKYLAVKLLLLFLIGFSYYLFWINRLNEAIFVAYSAFLIAMLIFVFFIHYIKRFKAGPFEFEKSPVPWIQRR